MFSFIKNLNKINLIIMKLTLQLKKALLFIIIGIVSTSLFAQTNVENFDYPASTLLTDPSIGFTEKTNTPSIDVYSPGLEYSGLAVSGVGNAAHINISEDGDSDPQTFGPERIARKPFFASSVSSGTVYMSFLANIKTTIGGDFNNFFIAVSDFNSDRLRGRVMAKDDGAGKVQFGFTKGFSSDINWTSDLYDYNKTYLFVVKYEFVAGSDNDVASLFVFDQGVDGVPASEPVTPTLTANEGTGSDLANIKIIHLRQRKVEAVVDGIALGTSWSDVIVDSSLSVNSTSKNQNSIKVYQEGNYINVIVDGTGLAGNTHVNIFNISGQLLINKNINNQNSFTIDTNNKLQNGIYILNIKGDNANYFKKFILNY